MVEGNQIYISGILPMGIGGKGEVSTFCMGCGLSKNWPMTTGGSALAPEEVPGSSIPSIALLLSSLACFLASFTSSSIWISYVFKGEGMW